MIKLLTQSQFLSASIVLALTMTISANAATVSFGNANNLNGVAQLATDSSGLTSVNVPSNNLTTGSNGFIVETFDQATQLVPFPPGSEQYNDPGFDTTCAVNGVGAGVTVTTNGIGAFGVRKGSVGGVAAAPRDDTTCFGYTPQDRATLPSWVEVDYSGFLTTIGDVGITFLGFYWGSIDRYNDFTFFNKDGDLIQTMTGRSLLTQAGGTSGDQDSPESNLYVAIDFTFAESFTKLRIDSTGAAGEFDNIVIGLQNRPAVPVPAPTGIALLGLGLLGLGLRKRLRK
jgi:hypothetical protein